MIIFREKQFVIPLAGPLIVGGTTLAGSIAGAAISNKGTEKAAKKQAAASNFQAKADIIKSIGTPPQQNQFSIVGTFYFGEKQFFMSPIDMITNAKDDRDMKQQNKRVEEARQQKIENRNIENLAKIKANSTKNMPAPSTETGGTGGPMI